MTIPQKVSKNALTAFARESGIQVGNDLGLIKGLDAAFEVMLEERGYVSRMSLVRELLAHVHRDGSHHTDGVGFEQSVKDAIEEYHKLRDQIERAESSSAKLSPEAIGELDVFKRSFEEAQRNFQGFFQVYCAQSIPDYAVAVRYTQRYANERSQKEQSFSTSLLKLASFCEPAHSRMNETSQCLGFERKLLQYMGGEALSPFACKLLRLFTVGYTRETDAVKAQQRTYEMLTHEFSCSAANGRKAGVLGSDILFDVHGRTRLLDVSWDERMEGGSLLKHHLHIAMPM